MSRRYWSREPSSYADFRCGLGVPLIRAPAPSSRDSSRDVAREERRRVDALLDLSVYPFPEPVPADSREPGEAFRGIRRIAVVDHERPAFHERIGDEAPVPAVEGVVPIVAEDEVVPLWDDQWPPVVTRGRRGTRRASCPDEVVALPLELVAGRIH